MVIITPDTAMKYFISEKDYSYEVSTFSFIEPSYFGASKCLWIVKKSPRTTPLKSDDNIINTVMDFSGENQYVVKQQRQPNLKKVGRKQLCIDYDNDGWYDREMILENFDKDKLIRIIGNLADLIDEVVDIARIGLGRKV
jgi:hypothetical protein